MKGYIYIFPRPTHAQKSYTDKIWIAGSQRCVHPPLGDSVGKTTSHEVKTIKSSFHISWKFRVFNNLTITWKTVAKNQYRLIRWLQGECQHILRLKVLNTVENGDTPKTQQVAAINEWNFPSQKEPLICIIPFSPGTSTTSRHFLLKSLVISRIWSKY